AAGELWQCADFPAARRRKCDAVADPLSPGDPRACRPAADGPELHGAGCVGATDPVYQSDDCLIPVECLVAASLRSLALPRIEFRYRRWPDATAAPAGTFSPW